MSDSVEKRSPCADSAAAEATVDASEARHPFVLDLAENPHPRMLANARSALRASTTCGSAADYWRGYLAAMCDATGESSEAIKAWVVRGS